CHRICRSLRLFARLSRKGGGMRFLLVGVLASWIGFAQTPGTPAGSPPPRKLSIEEAEAIAVKPNPRVAASMLDALAANHVTIEARSRYYQHVFGVATGAGGEYNTRIAAGALNASTVYNRLAGGAAVSQLISDFGRTGQLVQSAKLRAQSLDERSVFSR